MHPSAEEARHLERQCNTHCLCHWGKAKSRSSATGTSRFIQRKCWGQGATPVDNVNGSGCICDRLFVWFLVSNFRAFVASDSDSFVTERRLGCRREEEPLTAAGQGVHVGGRRRGPETSSGGLCAPPSSVCAHDLRYGLVLGAPQPVTYQTRAVSTGTLCPRSAAWVHCRKALAHRRPSTARSLHADTRLRTPRTACPAKVREPRTQGQPDAQFQQTHRTFATRPRAVCFQ